MVYFKIKKNASKVVAKRLELPSYSSRQVMVGDVKAPSLSNAINRVVVSSFFVSLIALCFILFAKPVLAQDQSRGWNKADVASSVLKREARPLYKGSYALLIGASQYETWPTLSSIPTELDDVQETLESQQFQVERLVNPDSYELSRGIEKFIGKHGYDRENRLLIFFSGHGHSMNDKGFILPVDAPLPEDRKAFRRKALPMTQVMAWARDIESKHVLFLFDSCFSGSVFSSKSIPSVNERYIRKATSEPVRQFITAGGENDEVPAKSTFTPLFVKALQGAGDLNSDGYITGSELGVHLVQQVPRYVDQTPQYGKIRDYSLSQGDFVFVLDNDASNKNGTNNNQNIIAQLPKRSIYENELELNVELELWRSAKEFDGIDDYNAYLHQYPQGKFAGIAKSRIKALGGAQKPSAETWDELPSTKQSNGSDDWLEISPNSTTQKNNQLHELTADDSGWQPIK